MEIHKVCGEEEHIISMLIKEGITKIQRSLQYWKELSMLSRDREEEEWMTCTELWRNINETMNDR
jgi:hypothetical protein